MPIEIKELHIRVQVNDEPRAEEGQPLQVTTPANHEHLVRECVERVLEVLKQENQR